MEVHQAEHPSHGRGIDCCSSLTFLLILKQSKHFLEIVHLSTLIAPHGFAFRQHRTMLDRMWHAISQAVDHSAYLTFDLMEQLVSLDAGARSELHSHEVSANNNNPLLDRARWQALSHFFFKIWFSRAWIIQEVVFTKYCTVLCGSHATSWKTFANVSGFLATSN
jgi:hypothetical protein